MPIGNSRGVRLPKAVLDKYAIRDAVLVEQREEGLLLRSKRDRRLSWDETFKAMAHEREDWSDLDGALNDSLDAMNRYLDTVVVCPLTTRLHPSWRSRVQCACAGRRAEIAVDQIRTVSTERLGRRLDRLAPALATQLRRLITEMYGK